MVGVVEQDDGSDNIPWSPPGAATPVDAIRAAVDACSRYLVIRRCASADPAGCESRAGLWVSATPPSDTARGAPEQLITEAIRRPAGSSTRRAAGPAGALDEAATFIATADDPKRACRETRQVPAVAHRRDA